MEAENQFVQWLNSPLYPRIVGGLVVILSFIMIIGYSTFTWMTLDPDELLISRANPNTGEDIVYLELQGIVNSSDAVDVTAWELWSGENADVPSLDFDKVFAGEDADPRFVDRMLIIVPIFALLVAAYGGAYAAGAISPKASPLFTLLMLSAVMFLLAPAWRILSNIDLLGYEATQPTGPPRIRLIVEPILLDAWSNAHRIGTHQFFAGLLLLIAFVAWVLNYMLRNNMLRTGYVEEARENLQTYFSKRSITDYVTAIFLLGATAVILDWFVPLVNENQEKFIQLSYNGFSQGILLALIALGLVLIYKATDVINFAHGDVMMLGAYVFAELLVQYNMSLAGAIVVGALLLVVFGAIVERFVLRPLIGEPIISVIMVTIGLSAIIEAVVRLQWRSQILDWQEEDSNLSEGILPLFRNIFPEDTGIYRGLSVGTYPLYNENTSLPFPMRFENVYLMIVAFIFIGMLVLFFKYSKQGVAMRATADDQQAALSMGISVKRIFAIAWGIAALFAGIAGVLSGDTGTGASTGIPAIGLRAFPVIILGGLDSITGAVVGGIIIGLLQAYASGYIQPWLEENATFLVLQVPLDQVVPYILLLVVLMFKPYGLFGQKRIERV